MKNIQITEANGNVTISVDGSDPFELSEDKFKRISSIIHPKKLSTSARISAVLTCVGRPEGATVEEVAMFQDNGEQNCYNSIFVKLENEGTIVKSGEHRLTRRKRRAAVYVMNNGEENVIQ